MNTFDLIENGDSCTGCAACVSACPRTAIHMTTDQIGFVVPEVKSAQCVDCGICVQTCKGRATQKNVESEQQYWFGQAIDNSLLKNSASGGIFSALATQVLRDGGVVFGASLSMNDGVCSVAHRYITDESQLRLLQNSKYVQSDIGNSFIQCREFLKEGRLVLFSGTPCQIAGVKAFLRKHYENLLTVDLVCHGVPSLSFFNKYLAYLQKKRHIEITDLIFRSKDRGWGFKGKLYYKDSKGIEGSKVWNSTVESYYRTFLQSKIYRPNCYQCEFACKERVGDLTLGDFWGGDSALREFRQSIDRQRGVSCILVNSPAGLQWIERLKPELNIYPTTYKVLSSENYQLSRPSEKPNDYNLLIEMMSAKPYAVFEHYFRKQQGLEFYYRKLIGLVPYRLKALIRKHL